MSKPTLPELPENIVEVINAARGGFNKMIDMRFTGVTYDEIRAEVVVTPDLHQPYGLVHGGIYSAMIESLASLGAAIHAMPLGRSTVGLENNTSFLKAVRSGTLYGVAVPLTRGKRTHVWTVAIHDGEERLVATGRVRMICLEQGAAVAGKTVGIGG